MKKTSIFTLSILLISYAILSYDVLRNFVFSRDLIPTMIHAVLIGLAIGLGISKKFLLPLPIIITEGILYWSITWTSWPVSVWITTRLAPILGGIAGVVLLIKGFKENTDK